MLAATVMGWNGTQQRGLRTVSYRLLGVSLNVWFTKRFNILHQEKKRLAVCIFFHSGSLLIGHNISYTKLFYSLYTELLLRKNHFLETELLVLILKFSCEGLL